MTRPGRAAFRGEVHAAAYLLDPAVVGEDEVRARVLDRWSDGTRLSWWPDGRWLVLLGAAETVRAEHAPGLPLVGGPDGLSTPGEPLAPGVVRVPHGDDTEVRRLDQLPPVDVGSWLAPGAVRAVTLTPLESTVAEPVVPDPLPAVTAPDLRGLARIGPTSSRAAARAAGRPSHPGPRTVVAVVAVLTVVTALAVIAGVVAWGGSGGGATRAARPTPVPTTTAPPPVPRPTDAASITVDPSEFELLPNGVVVERPVDTDGSGAWWSPFIAIPFGLAVGLAVRGLRRRSPTARARAARAAAARPPQDPRGRRWRDAATRWVLGTPAGGVIGRRHRRYLAQLDEDFARGRWDDALSSAIALGGAVRGLLTLRLPGRRASLSPLAGGAVARTTPYDAQVGQHLRQLYVDAAARLEQSGETERAAFVLAVLLGDAPGAVALLERHERLTLAAELAEARQLGPALVVRLWWQAGNRERAVDVARARGAFASALVRLERVDAGLAHDLRAAWVDTARAAGDMVTAVEAAWPDPDLRRRSLPDLQTGLEVGGPAAGLLLVRFLAGDWDTTALAGTAVDLVAAATPAATGLRTGFLTALAHLPASDARLDRRLCSSAALVTACDPHALAGLPAAEAGRTVGALRRRADPLLAADLPPWRAAPASDATLTADLDGPAGLRALSDAVVLPDASILVALGDDGVRWLTPTGAVRAQWSVPAHRLVLSDHGGVALLLRDAGEQVEVHRLDLADRRVRSQTVLRVRAIASSFDGAHLVTVDDEGVAVLDLLRERPRVLWRELSPTQPVLALSRTATRLTAVALAEPLPWPRHAAPAGERLLELFGWDLPSMTLRVRRQTTPPPGLRVVLATSWHAVLRGPSAFGAEGVTHVHGRDPTRFEPLTPDARLTATADTLVTVHTADEGGFTARLTTDDGSTATVRGPAPAGEVTVHRHGDIATVHDRAGGRVLGLDLRRGELVSRVRTAL